MIKNKLNLISKIKWIISILIKYVLISLLSENKYKKNYNDIKIRIKLFWDIILLISKELKTSVKYFTLQLIVIQIKITVYKTHLIWISIKCYVYDIEIQWNMTLGGNSDNRTQLKFR